MQHFNLTITGRVQRVGFRFSAMEAAYRYSVRGFVMNSGDNDVVIEAEGTPENLDKFLNWCRKGPMGSKVEQVAVAEGDMKHYATFEIVNRS